MSSEVEMYLIDFERTILSSIIFRGADGLKSEEINLFHYLEYEDFYLPAHQIIFSAITGIYERGDKVDEFLLKNELLKSDNYDEFALLEVISSNPISNLKPYITELRNKRVLRSLQQTSLDIKKNISEMKEPSEIIALVEQNIDSIIKNSSIGNNINSAADLMEKHQEDDGIRRVSTGYAFLDDVVGGGFDEGGLVIISGEEESGKTHLACSIIERASLSIITGLISIEFGENDYAARIIKFKKNEIAFNPKNIRTNFDSIEISEITATLYKFAHEGVRIAVIDSLHFAEYLKSTSPTHEVNYIAKKIKHIANKTRMVIILLAQGSKKDYSDKKAGVRDSAAVPHMAKCFIRVSNGKHPNIKLLHWHKNKQTKFLPTQEVEYCSDGEIRIAGGKEVSKNKKVMNLKELD